MWTKHWVVHHLPLIEPFAGYPFGGIGLLKSPLITLSIVHTTNTGAAWSLFSNFPSLLLFVRLVITLGLIAYLLFFEPPKQLKVPLTFVAAGALGNIIDFYLYGHVVDMIYCIFYRYSYPIFNIADSVIFCSVAYLLISTVWRKKALQSNVT